MRHVAPIISAIGHAGWSNRAVEDEVINASPIDNHGQVVHII